MCTHPCPTRLSLECPNGELCFGGTTCNIEFSNEFFVDYFTGSCFKDAAPCPGEVFTCEKVPPPIQTYKSIENCCEQGQSWVDFGFCTSRSIGNYTNGWVVDYGAEKCGEYCLAHTYCTNLHSIKPFSCSCDLFLSLQLKTVIQNWVRLAPIMMTHQLPFFPLYGSAATLALAGLMLMRASPPRAVTS